VRPPVTAEPQAPSIPLHEVLLENARLQERLEGRDQVLNERERVIDELRDDRQFLREELVEARKLRGDVKEISHEMLETLKAAALRGLLEQTKNPPPVAAEIITPTGESRPA
jgi:vacuolar-type H+-ATPase subunit I/STV1